MLDRSPEEHANAMRHANDGYAHRYLGDEDASLASFRLAWESERRAAMGLLEHDVEPSRSVLFSSAASLALLCGEYDDARVLAQLGLDGQPRTDTRVTLESLARHPISPGMFAAHEAIRGVPAQVQRECAALLERAAVASLGSGPVRVDLRVNDGALFTVFVEVDDVVRVIVPIRDR
jgi:hypothetical protein